MLPFTCRPSGYLMWRAWQVDWTIRLIVVNSKLSGADSFQATVEHCFGKPGLIAISVCLSPLLPERLAEKTAACAVFVVSPSFAGSFASR